MLKNTLILFLLVGFMTITNANNFTTESQLATRYNGEIAEFWLQGQFSHFNGVNDKRINYSIFSHDKSDLDLNDKIQRKCLVISSGRSEGYLKYKELSYDLFNLGFNIFLIDHRGQGISERILENPHKGYVENFQYYVNDLASFIDKIVSPYCTFDNQIQKPYMLGHSMGGAIAARYIQDYPDSIQAAVLSSPMLGLNGGGIPDVITKSLIKFTNKINQWFGEAPWYFMGQKDYVQNDFLDNPLMHSELRFQQFGQLYQQTPAIQLGGVTVRWLDESISALETIFANIDKISTPTLVIQAGDDKIVKNESQDDFCQQLHQLNPQSCPDGKPLIVKGAYHELFFESDVYRQQALTAVAEWFEKHDYR
jgi:lysophospholipase